jgi:hypothetical protein
VLIKGSRKLCEAECLSFAFEYIDSLYRNERPPSNNNKIVGLLLFHTNCSVGPSFLPHFRPVFQELSELLATIDSANSTFRTSTYHLISRLLQDFGAGLHSNRETKALDSLAKIALTDISSLTSTTTIPSLSVLPPFAKLMLDIHKIAEAKA